MDRSVRTLWVKALQSGKYKQGRQQFVIVHEDGSVEMDALGVLCEVANLGKWEKPLVPGVRPKRIRRVFSDGKDHSFLTPEALKKVGLTHEEQLQVSYLNDGWMRDPMTFDDLSLWIVKQL